MKSLNFAEMRQQMDRDGYVLCREFFDPAVIAKHRRELKEIFLIQLQRLGLSPGNPDDEQEFAASLFQFFQRDTRTFINCGHMCQHLASLHRLGTDPRILDTLRGLGFGFPNISTRPLIQFNSRHVAKTDGYWKSPPHQDWRSMQGSLNATVLWVPLIGIDEALGALEVSPGSHKLGLLETSPDDQFRQIVPAALDGIKFVSISTNAGDALFFSSFLVHRSGTNRTDRLRWSCHYRYNDLAEATYIERGFPHPYTYKPQQELITPDFPVNEKVTAKYRKSAA
jgi:phytanoyl-CoA hydroxylase